MCGAQYVSITTLLTCITRDAIALLYIHIEICSADKLSASVSMYSRDTHVFYTNEKFKIFRITFFRSQFLAKFNQNKKKHSWSYFRAEYVFAALK